MVYIDGSVTKAANESVDAIMARFDGDRITRNDALALTGARMLRELLENEGAFVKVIVEKDRFEFVSADGETHGFKFE